MIDERWETAHRAAMAACDAGDAARRAGLYVAEAAAFRLAARLERAALDRYDGGPDWRRVLARSLAAIKANRRDAARRARR